MVLFRRTVDGEAWRPSSSVPAASSSVRAVAVSASEATGLVLRDSQASIAAASSGASLRRLLLKAHCRNAVRMASPSGLPRSLASIAGMTLTNVQAMLAL
jgi:hypothetical protein